MTPRTAAQIEAEWTAEAQARAAQCDYDVSHLQFRLARYEGGSLSLNYEASHNRTILRRALGIAIKHHAAGAVVLQAAE